MRRRGLVVAMVGIVIAAGSYAALVSLPAFDYVALDGVSSLFADNATPEEIVAPGETAEFQYAPPFSGTLSDPEYSFMWGVQIVDYEPGDSLSVLVTDPLGNALSDTPVLDREAFVPYSGEYYDTYRFEVTNTGGRTLSTYMTFLEADDFEGNVMMDVVYLGVVAMVFITGLLVAAAGAILSLVDWRSGRNAARY